MLSQIKLIFTEKNTVSLVELTQQLNAEPDAVRGMLSHWIRKGRIRPFQKKAGCGSKCGKCDPATTEMYQWVLDS